MQTLYADPICSSYMQTLYADPICSSYMQTLYAAPICSASASACICLSRFPIYSSQVLYIYRIWEFILVLSRSEILVCVCKWCQYYRYMYANGIKSTRMVNTILCSVSFLFLCSVSFHFMFGLLSFYVRSPFPVSICLLHLKQLPECLARRRSFKANKARHSSSEA